MNKPLLNLSLIVGFGGAIFAQSNQVPVSTKEAKVLRNLNEPSALPVEGVFGTRAEGDVIWEDDFSDAANWSFSNTSNPPHGWSITSNLNAPPFTALAPVNFATGSNGYAFCNSDEAGDGSETNATIQWNGAPIDCSNNPNVSLKFNTVTRNWSSQYFLRISADNGTTWTEIPVLTHITTNVNTANSETVNINISSYINSSSEVLIGFRYQASWGWFWAIDDIELYETWNYDLEMGQNLNSIGLEATHYTIMPVNQVTAGMSMGFGVEARNIGALPMSVSLAASQGAWSGVGSAVTMNTLQAGTDSLTILDANGFPIPSTVGTYNVALTLQTDETLQNAAAASKTQRFSVSSTVMAGDNYDGTPASITGGFTGWADPSGDPGIGKDFEVFANGTIGRTAVGISNVATANQAQFIGNELIVLIYKAVDGELVLAGISEPHILTASNFGNLVQCYFEEPIQVVAGDYLVAMATFSETTPVPIAFSGRHRILKTYGLDGGNLFSWSSATEFYRDIPVIRLDFADYSDIANETLIASDVVVYPNPAEDNATITYTLTAESNVSIVVRDLSGKVVYTTESGLLGAGSYNTTIDLNTFAQGMYTVTLTANGAQTTQKLIKK
jgi:hypothetical protein